MTKGTQRGPTSRSLLSCPARCCPRTTGCGIVLLRNSFHCRTSESGGRLRLSAINDPVKARRLSVDLERRKQEAQDALQQGRTVAAGSHRQDRRSAADVDHDLGTGSGHPYYSKTSSTPATDLTWAETQPGENDVANGSATTLSGPAAEALAAGVARTFDAGPDAVRVPDVATWERAWAVGGRWPAWSPNRWAGAQGDHQHARPYGGVLMFGMLTRSRAGDVRSDIPRCRSADGPQGVSRGHGEPLAAGPQRGQDQPAQVHRRCAVRRHQESRDRLKVIQRQLRDHYREIANQTTRSLNESLQAMLAVARVQETERATRVGELGRQANILRQVIDNADRLAAGGSAANREWR